MKKSRMGIAAIICSIGIAAVILGGCVKSGSEAPAQEVSEAATEEATEETTEEMTQENEKATEEVPEGKSGKPRLKASPMISFWEWMHHHFWLRKTVA